MDESTKDTTVGDSPPDDSSQPVTVTPEDGSTNILSSSQKVPDIAQTSSPPNPVVQGQPSSIQPSNVFAAPSAAPAPSQAKGKRPKWLVVAVFAAVLLIGGGAAAYVSLYQRSPEKVMQSALRNTADGLEAYLVSTTENESEGFRLEGTIDAQQPTVVDASMEGAWKGANGRLTGNVGVAGARVDFEMITDKKESANYPDLYMKLSGLDGVGAAFGSSGMLDEQALSVLNAINDQWYFIDHTLFEQAAISAQEESAAIELTPEETKEAINKLMAVMKERLFVFDTDKSVFTMVEAYGKEDFEGLSTQKMRVKVDRDRFKDFVVALKDAAKETKLEEMLTAGQDKSLEEVLDFDTLISDIESADFSKAEADVWVEARGMFIRNIRFYPVEDKKESNYLDLGLDYEGGDIFPILLKATIDDEGSKGTLAVTLKLNKTNGDVEMNMNADIEGEGTSLKADASLKLTASNESVDFELPADPRNIFELLGALQGTSASGLDVNDPSLFEDVDAFDELPLDDVEIQQ